jgi:putative aminopeptidase FrvX
MSTTLLADLCSVPTAPFVEHRVTRFVERFAAKRPNLSLSRDAFGNLLLELKGTGEPAKPRWVFTAHTDHPGFVARRMLADGLLEAAFHGWVLADFFPGQRVRFFDGPLDGPAAVETVATVVDFTIGEERKVPETVRLRVRRPVSPGSPGMWDQPPAKVRGGKFYGRVCDDLAGAAAALAMLDQLHRRPPEATVAVLLTRAEEEGFIGAIAASLKPKLLRKTDNLVAIECSAEQPYAPQGGGAIVRVGDRTSVFNSDLTYFITQQAEALAKAAARKASAGAKTTGRKAAGGNPSGERSAGGASAAGGFKFQRALMPGGTCEATVYDAYGFKAASICVPLGNYHNMDRAKGKIGPEYIDLGDWDSMVKLFVKIARDGHTHEPGMKALKARVEKRFEALRPLLDDAATMREAGGRSGVSKAARRA